MRRWFIGSLLTLGVLFGGIAVACSGRGANSATVSQTPHVTPSTGGTVGGPDVAVPGPASRYAPLQTELPGSFIVDVPNTFAQNISTFSSSYLFNTAQQGQQLAQQWKIIDGFKVLYDPDGLAAAVLQGSYYIDIEVYLFQDTSGAHQAYQYIQHVYASTSGSQAVPVKALANESSGYQLISGKIATSSMVAVYDSFIFRRGNVVCVVRTTGGKPFMTIDYARNIAVIMDDRILGKRKATVPTPIPTPAISLPPTPLPSATTGAGS